MTTWTSRPIAALGITMLLGACEAPVSGAGLFAGLLPPSDTALPAVPLTQAKMMRGRVTLVPPDGYCIDPESLSQSFALMARCDTLGAPTGGAGAPVGVLSVSFARTEKDADLTTPQQITTAFGLGPPEEVRSAATGVVFMTTGTPPSPDLHTHHWRSISTVSGFTMGAALFGPQGRRAVSLEGAQLIEEMIQRTTQKSNAA